MPFLLMALSGFAGLGYQIIWTQQGALWLGHETAAVLAVVAAFFGGISLGSWLLGPRIEASQRPVLWYVGCECVIAVWSLALTLFMSPVSDWLLTQVGSDPTPAWHWAMSFAGTFLLLLPATAAMGATLPAMERLVARRDVGGRSIAGLYSSNTLGAVLGVLATAFWLLPQYGLTRTAGVCIAFNLLCAALAWQIFPSSIAPIAATSSPPQSPVMQLRLAVAGLLGIGYEVIGVRVLSQVTEGTVYTFALILSVYLIGTAAGASIYQRRFARIVDRDGLQARLIGALAWACLAGTACLWAAGDIKAVALNLMAANFPTAVLVETFIALLVFGAPTVAMGMLFSHLTSSANTSGIDFGKSLAANTFGAAMAPLLIGVVALSALGAKSTMLLIACGYLLLLIPLLRIPQVRRFSWHWTPIGPALALAIWAPPLAHIDIPEGGRLVSYDEGSMAAVSVVEDADGVARLHIDNHQQEGSSATFRVDARQAWLPILLHPAPQRALFLGLGTGITASAAALDSSLDVEAVELLPEVIAAADRFQLPVEKSRPSLHIIAADARRYVRSHPQRYDIIVSDNFHPARSGSGSLYTTEHFEAVRRALTRDGLFCQWLPLHQLDLTSLRSIVASFLVVYPEASAMLASNSLDTPVLGLIGRADDTRLHIEHLQTRLSAAALPPWIRELGVEDEMALLGSFVAGPGSLARFSHGAVLNTDDHPTVAYLAPRITYAPDTLPRDRLIELLLQLTVEPADLLVDAPAHWNSKLVAYWQARNRFIETGRNVRPMSDVRQILAQVQEPLLSILRVSPDFRPAYDPLVRMATALVPVDRPRAVALFQQLTEIQPARAEAPQALLALANVPRLAD